MFEDESALISILAKLKKVNGLKNYIDFIQFPYYRNLELNARINFNFPFTVFIGQNGCGKSSALHALYGTVKGKTPGNFWFDTKIDPIQYYNDEKKRHSFWYSYNDSKGVNKEVVKARIQRADNPNYWETSRPLTWAGMKKGARHAPIEKNVLYLDFRGELSAFDKFFYFGDLKNRKSKNKQEFIRRRSLSLKKIFDGEKEFVRSRQRNLNEKLENLLPEELQNISYVLGREYSFCKSVKHSIFRNEGYSVLFQTNFAKYSEAFAGSGEMAVVRLVREVLAAPDYSLILLDEPEVSLHPGAQARLKLFLLDQIKKKKHQIIITSHSPILIKGLPKEAIKVFNQNPSNGRFLINENLIPEEAFFHIEFPIDKRKNIIVEDKLAREILSSVLSDLGAASTNVFNIRYYPGGESVIKKDFIPVYCREENPTEYILFDGDQKIAKEHYDWRHFSASELSVKKLQTVIKEITNENIKFPLDSNELSEKEKQELELQKKYLDFYRTNVFYLPKNAPEEIIWNLDKAEQLMRMIIQDNEDVKKHTNKLELLTHVKNKFSYLTQIVLDNNDSNNIFSIHKLFIKAWIENKNADFEAIRILIQKIMDS
jgi:predicted ATPase